VLVVEDDPRIATMLEKGLRARLLDFETVRSGAEAVARINAGGVDVQLLDLGLPDMDGLEVLRLLRDSQRSVPVIVITARSDPHDRQMALDLGVAEYLTKPFDWAQLWAAIDACVADRPGASE
jgi:two-component system response regulator QseB